MTLHLVLCSALTIGIVGDSSAAPKTLLVAGSDGSYTARGLAALSIEHQRVSPGELGQVCLFDYDLVIWGFDEDRTALGNDPAAVRPFVESGGVLVGFRSSAEDAWLPIRLQRDKAYALGKIVERDHPIFNTPHHFDRDLLLDVHGGSIYRAFFDLGEGWIPLVSTGAEQSWDKTEPASTGPHYGIAELPLGKGRILLVQMIPEYHWFHDSAGDSSAAGARLFENLVRYALAHAPRLAASRPPRRMPEGFHADWHDLFEMPRRGDGLPLDDPAWQLSSHGPYSAKVDRRGVLTFTHPDVPSQAGNFVQISRMVPVPAGAKAVTLRWYYTDTYCGGRERILGGAKHGQTALENLKRDIRHASVLVNGEPVWKDDVLGRNPQPAKLAFRTADITDAVQKAGRCEITLRIDDQKGSGEEPFAIDAFFGTVELITDLCRGPAADVFSGDGLQVSEAASLRLQNQSGAVEAPHAGPAGRFALALRLRDEHTGQSRLRLLAGGKAAAEWRLTADDCRTYWAVTPPVALEPADKIRIEVERDGDEGVTLYELAVIPEKLLPRPPEPALPPTADGQTTPQVRFPITVHELAGVARQGEVAAQGLPFPAGCLARPDTLRVIGPDGQAVPVQTRQIAAWPDKTAKVVLVAFPADVAAGGTAAYTVEAGEAVAPVSSESGLTLRKEDDRLVIDTGAIVVTLSTTRGRILDEVRRSDRLIKSADEVWDLSLEEESGRVVRTRDAAVTDTEIVEGGPLRALVVRKGSFTDATGTLVDFRLHLEATAGSDALRVYAFIINREDQPEVYLKRWSMELERKEVDGKVWVGADEIRTAGEGDVLYQHRHDTLTWTNAGGPRSRQKGQSPGLSAFRPGGRRALVLAAFPAGNPFSARGSAVRLHSPTVRRRRPADPLARSSGGNHRSLHGRRCRLSAVARQDGIVPARPGRGTQPGDPLRNGWQAGGRQQRRHDGPVGSTAPRRRRATLYRRHACVRRVPPGRSSSLSSL